MIPYDWPVVTCGICGQPGKRIRYHRYAHAHAGSGTGPNTHAFVPDIPDYGNRVDEQLKDRRYFERRHRDEVRASAGFEREVGR